MFGRVSRYSIVGPGRAFHQVAAEDCWFLDDILTEVFGEYRMFTSAGALGTATQYMVSRWWIAGWVCTGTRVYSSGRLADHMSCTTLVNGTGMPCRKSPSWPGTPMVTASRSIRYQYRSGIIFNQVALYCLQTTRLSPRSSMK